MDNAFVNPIESNTPSQPEMQFLASMRYQYEFNVKNAFQLQPDQFCTKPFQKRFATLETNKSGVQSIEKHL